MPKPCSLVHALVWCIWHGCSAGIWILWIMHVHCLHLGQTMVESRSLKFGTGFSSVHIGVITKCRIYIAKLPALNGQCRRYYVCPRLQTIFHRLCIPLVFMCFAYDDIPPLVRVGEILWTLHRHATSNSYSNHTTTAHCFFQIHFAKWFRLCWTLQTSFNGC